MYFLGLGILLVLMKWQAIGPVADWSWWTVLAPFALAVVWWAWADWSGYTKRKAMEREDERKLARINRQRQAIGQKPKAAPPRRR
ncbi:MAG: TIGR04438 family Trp-rich protein [Pseudomonadota bacterium]|nr:TIGR04438 family Trp-rich protein [Pseudomonadota bacterium]